MRIPGFQRRFGLLAVMALVLWMPLSLMAAPSTYTGEAPVSSQSEAERAEALKTALAQIVIRLSGDAGALARSDVASAVGRAGHYVLQYQYQRDVATDPDTGALQVHTTLVAQFDRNAVDQMLAELGLSGAQSVAAFDTTPSEARVWISGIQSADDYAHLLGYLSHQQSVREAWPLEVRGDGLLVRLSLAGPLQYFLDGVTEDATLRVINAAPALEEIDATLALSR